MKVSGATKQILKFAIRVHEFAVALDCKLKARASALAFENAKHQFVLVNAAKKRLEQLQAQAVEAYEASNAEDSKAYRCSSAAAEFQNTLG